MACLKCEPLAPPSEEELNRLIAAGNSVAELAKILRIYPNKGESDIDYLDRLFGEIKNLNWSIRTLREEITSIKTKLDDFQ